MTGTKACSSCREEKEKTEFGAYLGSRDGLRSHCKECDSRHSREFAARNRRANDAARMRHNDVLVAEKYCPACGETKSSDAFYRHVANNNGLDSCCKDCARQRSKAFRNRQNTTSDALAAKSGNRWSSEDDQFVITNYGIMTQYQMAIELGRTLYAVQTRIRALRRDGKLA